jgi:glycosyltransferase involved in cell wall biosynthesis
VKVVVGLPLYNGGEHLRDALESLLVQTHRDFALVVVDDYSTDESTAIAERYAALDPRIHFERNPDRLGMIGNWRRTFEVARERNPDMEYFAWGSDHDLWHPHWLSTLLTELDDRPDVVAAYPTTGRVSASGEELKWTRKRLDTTEVARIRDRLPQVVQKMMAGDQVYALFRAEALERAGIFRRVLLPDRLLLSEISLYGEFRQVPERLFFRRFLGEPPTLDRQRRAFFPDGPPLYSYLPWWFLHAVTITWALVVKGSGRPELGRLSGALVAARYSQLAAYWQLRRHGISIGRAVRSWSRRTAREANRKRKRAWRRMLRAGGRAKRRLLALAAGLLARLRRGRARGAGT